MEPQYMSLNSNGGLIDFQDNHVLEQPMGMMPVANLQPYTTQSAYITCNGQIYAAPAPPVMMGPPSEVYAHGKVYKIVEEPLPVAAPAAPEIKQEAPASISHADVDKRIAQKVNEFMQMNKPAVGSKSHGKSRSAKDDFKSTLERINSNAKNTKNTKWS